MSPRKPELTVVVDTREQRPWSFPDLQTVVQKLDAGDYSFRGGESSCAIERKSLDDYVQSVTHGRERFMREIDRLAGLDNAAVLVEADPSDLWRESYQSRATPQSLWASALAITSDHGVPVLFCGGRKHAQWSCLWLLRRWQQEALTGQETGNTASAAADQGSP